MCVCGKRKYLRKFVIKYHVNNFTYGFKFFEFYRLEQLDCLCEVCFVPLSRNRIGSCVYRRNDVLDSIDHRIDM